VTDDTPMPNAVRVLRALLVAQAVVLAVVAVRAGLDADGSVAYRAGFATPIALVALWAALLAYRLPRRSGRGGLFAFVVVALLVGAATARHGGELAFLMAVATFTYVARRQTAAYLHRNAPHPYVDPIAALAEEDDG
jgi:protein-S-isoprenylcysteine O-methyltransferase Ste14